MNSDLSTLTHTQHAIWDLEALCDEINNLFRLYRRLSNNSFPGGIVLPGFTAGSVIFINAGLALAEDNANLFWDDANDQLRLGNGVAALPSLTFAAGTTSGFYSIAANQIGVSIATALDFSFTANSFNVLAGSNITMADAQWIGNSAATARLHFDSSGATDYAYILGARVGIGTATPGDIFEIYDSTPALRIRDSNVYTASAAFIEIGGENAGAFERTGWLGAGSTGDQHISVVAHYGNVRLYTTFATGDIDFYPGNSYQGVFKSDGKFGVGTTGPNAKIESLATTEQLRLSYDADSYCSFTVASDSDLTIKPAETGQIKFQPTTNSTTFAQFLDADGGTPIFNIDSTNERVGIGTNAPGAVLDVVGGASTTLVGRTYLTYTATVSSNTSVIGFQASPTVNNTVSSGSFNLYGVDGAATVQSSFTGTLATLRALNFVSYNFAPAGRTLTEVMSINAAFRHRGAASIGTLYGAHVEGTKNAGGTGGITNLYAYYADFSALSATNEYGIWIVGDSNYKNLLPGWLGIGATPIVPLQLDTVVNGNNFIMRSTQASAYISFYEGSDWSKPRGNIGYGDAGALFASQLTDSLGIRGEQGICMGKAGTISITIDTNNRVCIGSNVTSGSATCHIEQASTTAAIPAAYIKQADVSEEMIQFETTIGVGNAIEAVGAKTLTTTHFIKVTLPGGLTRYIPAGTIA